MERTQFNLFKFELGKPIRIKSERQIKLYLYAKIRLFEIIRPYNNRLLLLIYLPVLVVSWKMKN